MVNIEEQVLNFIEDIKRSKKRNSYQLALKSCHLIKEILQSNNFSDIDETRKIFKTQVKLVRKLLPTEATIANIFYRFLKMIQEEKESNQENQDPLKEVLLGNVDEMISEVESSLDNIGNFFIEILHPHQKILTFGSSPTILHFFKKALAKRTLPLEVFVLTDEKSNELLSFQHKNLLITQTPTCNLFSILPLVQSAIISAHTVSANGGIKSKIGTYNLALSAKYFSVPLIVCAPMFKFSPHHLCSIEQESSNIFLSPFSLLPSSFSSYFSKNLKTKCPVFDYIHPDFISLILTNLSGNNPSQMYRFLSEFYNYEDLLIEDEI